ncbi:MAG: TonB-dependent receptor [Novosphingobium sp.]|nr:TonB-dependent receptor [Novosphingobium sp.]
MAGAAASALVMPGVAFAQDEGAAQAEEAASTGFGEIVVTAQRREEKLQDVPIAITAMSADNLRERGITNLQDMQASVPSLVIGPNGQASRDVMSPTIRGQSASFQGAPGVVVYMNEVPLPAANTLSGQGGPGNFVDLQNVQVLSGVQGTLFGRNTTGGAILLTPAKPTDRLEGYVQGGYGNYNMTEFEAVLNVPLTDTLSVRVVGSSRDRDGFTHDVAWNKDRDNQHWRMGRIGIQWDPSDAISNYTMAYYGYSKTNGSGTIAKDFNYNVLGYYNYALGMNFDLSYLQDQIDQQDEWGIRKTAHSVDDFAKLETWGVSNTTDIELADGLKLRNIFSYASLKSYYANDMDGTIAPVYDTGTTVESRNAPRDWFDVYTEELQLQGDAMDGKLTYTLGGFYFKQKPGGTMNAYAINVCDQASQAGCAINASSLTYRSESKALYAQATLDFGALTPALDSLRLTAGYRYTWDKVGGTNYSYIYVPGAGINGADYVVGCSWDSNIVVTDPATDCLFGATRKDSAGTWTLGLDYRPIDNLLLYAKVSRGYKAGGFNAYAVFADTRTFGPEFVTDYELGFKSDFHIGDAPARLNVNAFYLDYSKIQRGAGDYNYQTNGNGAVTLSTASAVVKGIEIDAMVKPVDILEIGGNYSHIASHYKSFTFDSNSGVYDCTAQSIASPMVYAGADMSCRPLQFITPNIFSVYGRLEIPTAASFGDVSLFVSYNWTDSQTVSPFYEETFPDGSVFEPGSKLPSFGLVNASVDWRNALDSGLDVNFFVTNLTNEKYAISNTNIYTTVGAQAQMYGEPRMYGIRLKYAFGN